MPLKTVPLKTPASAAPALNFKNSEESGNHCFGCGTLNPRGLHLHFEFDTANAEEISASAQIQLTKTHQGPPGYVHGGIIATLLDESMSKLNRLLDVVAMTRHMEVDYLRPVPIDAELTITSRHVRRDGRKIFHAAEIVGPDGNVLARGKALFVVIDPTLVAGKH